MSQLTVSKVADEAGISADTVRYYERIGLLPEPERSPSGYRLYDDAAVGDLRFIKRAQRHGLRLDEIGELMQIRQQGMCPCGHTRALLENRLSELDAEMEAISRLRQDIQHMIDDLPASGPPDGWQCGEDRKEVNR